MPSMRACYAYANEDSMEDNITAIIIMVHLACPAG